MAPVVAAAMKVSSSRKIFKCAGAVEAIVPVKNKTDWQKREENKGSFQEYPDKQDQVNPLI
ncbi:hypothetical protein [Pediococcus acidilactici]|uniref:hypothetical protein n=1 Tax=Pediococcus acidilactici TaxID=1254 RepID=UPI0039900B24